MKNCTVGEASARSGVSAKMIRHYEQMGLLPTANRTEAGYRLYSEDDVHRLRFVRHARDMGFSLKHIEDLLSLWQNKTRTSAQVKALAQAHLQTLNQKIAELQAMQQTLSELINSCHGNDRPDCPILTGLEQGTVTTTPHGRE